jgi:ribulose-5-phosphate 4-epimerase/fuculose-1-phosphate aldolase
MSSGKLTDAVARTKDELLEGLRVLDGEGMFEKAFGHISARVPDSGLIVMMGHVHDYERTLSQTEADDLIVIDAAGIVVKGRFDPPGEVPIHTEMMRARPDVNCVVHCHPRWPVALSITREEVLPVTWRSSIFYPKVPLFADPRQIETPAHGREVAAALGDGRAVTLMGHGVVCVGASVGQAVIVTLDLNDAARFQLDAMAAGGAHPLPGELVAHRRTTPPEAEGFTSAWNFYRAKWRSELNA